MHIKEIAPRKGVRKQTFNRFKKQKVWKFLRCTRTQGFQIERKTENTFLVFMIYLLPHNFLKLWLHLPLLHFQGLNRSHWGLLLHLLNIIMFFNIYKKRDPVSWSYNNICIGPWVSHIRLSDFSDQSSTFLFTDLSWTPIFFSSLSDLSNLSYALLIYLEFWVSFGRLSDLRKPRVLLKLKKNFFPEIQGSNQASFFPRFPRFWSSSKTLFSGNPRFWSSSKILFPGNPRFWSSSKILFSGNPRFWSSSKTIFSGNPRFWSSSKILFSGNPRFWLGSKTSFPEPQGSQKLYSGSPRLLTSLKTSSSKTQS